MQRAHIVIRQRRRVGEVGEERRRCHGEGNAFIFDDTGGDVGRPGILQYRCRLQDDRHHQAIEKAGLVRHRRSHQHHIVGAQADAVGKWDDVAD